MNACLELKGIQNKIHIPLSMLDPDKKVGEISEGEIERAGGPHWVP